MEYVIAIDLGGTSIKYALISASGEIKYARKIPSYATVSATTVIAQLRVATKDIIKEAAKQGITPKTIGIGTPGIIDSSGRVVLGGAENIVGWESIALANKLEATFHLPTRIDNDANLMGIGEQTYGAGMGCSDVLFITVGTGIGGAIILDGNPFRGYAARGTEIGHFPFIANGEKCACGAIGCWEHYASTRALVRAYSKATNCANSNGELIIQHYHQGIIAAQECLELHCQYLAQGIAGLVNIFSPQKVVIGGGISEMGSVYLDLISRKYKQFVMPPCAKNTELTLAQLGNKAGLLGAAKLALSLT